MESYLYSMKDEQLFLWLFIQDPNEDPAPFFLFKGARIKMNASVLDGDISLSIHCVSTSVVSCILGSWEK